MQNICRVGKNAFKIENLAENITDGISSATHAMWYQQQLKNLKISKIMQKIGFYKFFFSKILECFFNKLGLKFNEI